MRLIGRICGIKNPRAFQIVIDEAEDISALKRIFEQNTGIPVQYQILTTIVEGQYIKVIEGWSLEFYQFYDNQLINVHDFRKGEFHFNHPSCQKKAEEDQLRVINVHYYRKLGLISKSEENEKNQSLDNSDLNTCCDTNSSQHNGILDISVTSMKAYSALSLSESEDGYSLSKYNQIHQQFLKAVHDKKWRDAKQCLDLHNGLLKKCKKTKMQDIINESDSNGWNSLHYATYLEYDDICRKLIVEGADTNKTTTDDWTPLQLAVFKNNLKLVKVLTDSDDLNIDQQTSRGSALHLASAKGYIKIAQYLVLDKNANPELKHISEGKSPFDVATKQVRFFFRQHRQIKKFDIQTAMDYLENRKSFFNDMPKKPPMIRGRVQKQHNMFPCIVQERFLEINSDSCNLHIYSNESDAPLKPKEIISLTDILDVDILPRHWPMQSGLIYVRIIYQESMVLAFRTKEAAEHWIDKLNEAITYANYVEKKLRSFLREKELDDQQSTDKLFTMFSTIQINQQIITIKDEHHFCPKCDDKDPNSAIKLQQACNNIESGMNFQEILAKHVKKSFHIEISHSLTFKDFAIIGALGKGSFGRVFLVQQKTTEQMYAMKMLKKVSLIMKRQLKYAVTECNILKRSQNPFIVGLHYAFQTPNHLYMVLDYCSGGVLLHHIQRESRFSELTARFFVSEIILGIEYLHDLNVLYRDLKPENVLIGSDGHIKLTDFGLSKEHIADFDVSKSFCGSPAYLSPEMLLGKGFSKASDVYGIGCVLYEMLTGQPPFFDEDIQKLYHGIKMDEPSYPKYLSNAAKSFLSGLLKKNPKERLGYNSIQELKNHEFFEGIDWNRVYDKKYQPPQFLFANQHKVNTENSEKLQQRYMDQDYTKQNQKINRVKNWSFIGKV